MKSIILCFLFANLFFSFSVQAKESCDKALDSIPKFESSKKIFNEILQFKLKFGHCMDGGIAEGVATVIVESLDKNWSQIDDVSVTLHATDGTIGVRTFASFAKKFVVSHEFIFL